MIYSFVKRNFITWNDDIKRNFDNFVRFRCFKVSVLLT